MPDACTGFWLGNLPGSSDPTIASDSEVIRQVRSQRYG